LYAALLKIYGVLRYNKEAANQTASIFICSPYFPLVKKAKNLEIL